MQRIHNLPLDLTPEMIGVALSMAKVSGKPVYIYRATPDIETGRYVTYDWYYKDIGRVGA